MSYNSGMDKEKVPSFMKDPGWADLQAEIAAGQQARIGAARQRFDELKATLESVTEIESGVSALGTAAPKEELFVLKRKHARHVKLAWLDEKPLTEKERDELIGLWGKFGSEPGLDITSFLSVAEAEELTRKRQEGRIETIRRLTQSPKISFSPESELPEESSLGSELTDDEHAFILSKWFFQDNPGYRDYFSGMVFSEKEKDRLVWLFDEMKPESFISVAKLKEILRRARERRFTNGTGSEPHNSVRERLAIGGTPRSQANPDRHDPAGAHKPAGKAKPKPRRERRHHEVPDSGEADAGDSANVASSPPAGPAVVAARTEGNGSSKLGELVDLKAAVAASGNKSDRGK